MQTRGATHVQAALDALDLGITVIRFDSPTATASQASANAGCELGQIVKSLGFLINRSMPALALASGDQSIDERKLAAIYGVGRKKARLMTAAQCLEVLGYAPGSVPPIALREENVPVHLDESLRRYETVYASGGAANALFPISLAKLVELTRGKFADLART